MRFWDRLLLRGLRSHIPEGSSVLALERGASDAINKQMRKTTAVLTDDSLLLASPDRVRTVLTVVPRREIRSVEVVEENVVVIRYDDYARARSRVIRLDLQKYGDRDGIITKLRP
jgi:hypothetical protein